MKILKVLAFLVVVMVATGFLFPGNTQVNATLPLPMTSQYVKQMEFWEKRIDDDPFSILARVNFADAAITMARATGDEAYFARAERIIRTGLERHPQEEKLQLLLARLIMANHRFDEAFHIVDSLYQKTKKPELLAVRGDAALGRGDYEQAQLDFDAYAQSYPGYASFTRSAHTAILFGDTERALALLQKAKKAAGQLGAEPRAWMELRIGIVHLNAGELEQARDYFEKALAIAPDYYLALEHLAETYELEQKYSSAEPLLKRAIAIHRAPPLLSRLSVIENENGNRETAKNLQNEALELARIAYVENPAHARDYGSLLLDIPGKEQEALSVLQADWKLRRDDLEANYLLARAYLAIGDGAAAKKYIEHALRLGAGPTRYTELKNTLESSSV